MHPFSAIGRFFDVSRGVQGPDKPSSRSIYTTTLRLAWPAMLEALLITVIGMIDIVMVGALGETRIAAVGITSQPRFIFLALLFSLNIGVTAVVARRRGENDRLGACSVLRRSLVISLIYSIIFGCIALLISRPLMLFAGAEADIIDDACSYFNIMMLALPINAVTMTINAAQRGAGNTRISLVTNLTANLVNVFFNWLLIFGVWIFPELRVPGAAIATVIGNIVAMLIAILSVWRKDSFLSLRRVTPPTDLPVLPKTKNILQPVLRVTSSAAVEQLCVRVGFFIFAKVVSDLGTLPLTTHTIAMQITTLSFCFGDGLQIAAAALVGRNLGEKRPDLAHAHGAACQRIGFSIALCLGIICFAARGWLLRPFTADPAILLQGGYLMMLLAIMSPAQISQVIFSGLLRGAGDTRYIAIISLICIGLIRPFTSWLYTYPLGLGLYGAWLAMVIDQYLRLILSFRRFSSGKWKTVKL